MHLSKSSVLLSVQKPWVEFHHLLAYISIPHYIYTTYAVIIINCRLSSRQSNRWRDVKYFPLSSPVTGRPCCPHKVLKQQQPKSSMWFWVSCWLHLLKGEIITNRDSHQGYTLKNVFNIIQRRKTCGTILQCSRSFTDIFRPSKLKKTFPQKKQSSLNVDVDSNFLLVVLLFAFKNWSLATLKTFVQCFYINNTAKRIIKNERNPVDSIIILFKKK